MLVNPDRPIQLPYCPIRGQEPDRTCTSNDVNAISSYSNGATPVEGLTSHQEIKKDQEEQVSHVQGNTGEGVEGESRRPVEESICQ